jgi:hypothetical protein
MSSSRPRGRPALDPARRTPSVNVHVRLSASQYDATYTRARADRLTLAQWIRRALEDATRTRST